MQSNGYFPLPFYEFFYELDGKILWHVDNEKDLGICTNQKLSWTLHCEMAINKAVKQFNMLRRTCYFIYDIRQRKALYVSLVRSLFEHCCQIWAPQNVTTSVMFEKLQKSAVKWILNEQEKSYCEVVFLQKQRELDILPMKQKFLFSDLLLFYKIVNKQVEIKLPDYVTRIEPHDIIYSTKSTKSISDGKDNLKYRSSIIPKVKSFQDGYFFRTLNRWNEIPLEIRSSKNFDKFSVLLREHMWLILGLKPD